MDNLTATALHSMIHKQFESWNAQEDVMEELIEGLFQGCGKEDERDKIYARMVINAMEIAADISARVIFEILLTAGVIEPTGEDQLRKNVLSVVK